MILTRAAIQKAIKAKTLAITPFDESCLGPNSYDVHLGPHFAAYQFSDIPFTDPQYHPDAPPYRAGIDPRHMVHWTMPAEGEVLWPRRLYLAATLERTTCLATVPWLDGCSTIARHGISIHVCAGRGDVGFDGHWTLEITVVEPVRVTPGMRIAQVSFFQTDGWPTHDEKYQGRYQDQGPFPVPPRPETKAVPKVVLDALQETYRARRP